MHNTTCNCYEYDNDNDVDDAVCTSIKIVKEIC